MTKELKARELIKKFDIAIYQCDDTTGNELAIKQAKRCALICADEVLNNLSMLPQKDLKVKWETMFWQEVRKEIENYPEK